jgi:hypothetical protein
MLRDFLVRHAVAELWEIVWHIGGVGLVALAGAAWAWFSPFHKKTGLWVMGAAIFVMCVAGYYTNLGANYVRAKWEAAEDAAIAVGLEARLGAAADVKRAGARGMSDDPDNRDNDKGAVRPVGKNPVLRK